MKICFVGDMFFGGDLKGSKLENAIQIDEFHNADLRVINLEQSVSNSSYTAPKGTLYTDSNVINQLKELKVDAVNLAHNHIQDKGIEGISDTVNILNSSGIGTFGAGSNLHEARRPFFISESIVIFGYCDIIFLRV